LNIPKHPLDIIEALVKASRHPRPIGLTSYLRPPLQLDLIERLTSVKIQPIIFHHQKELREKIGTAIQRQKIGVIVGGVVSRETARKYGKPSVLIRYGKEALFDVIQYAIKIIMTARDQKEKNKLIQTIVEQTNEGILVLSSDKKVILLNRYAEKMLGVKAGGAIQRTMENPLPDLSMEDLLNEGRPEHGEIIAIRDVQTIVSKIPLLVDGRMAGVIVYLKRLEELQEQEIKARRTIHQQGLKAKYTIDHFAAKSTIMKELITRIRKFADSNSNILIVGESGVGKEIVAHSLHNMSQRNGQPFVALNCSTLQENLLDSELFGYEEGSFTGAKRGGKSGLFELAHKGTIFLDEIGELPLALQAKLLRVLQEKEIRRIGGEKNVPVDVRVLAATNADLSAEVAAGKFRRDLFFRLATLCLCVPPLRERFEDLPLLIEVFLQQFGRRYNKKRVYVSPALMDRLRQHAWPGNVRELENFLERYVILSEGSETDDRLGMKLLEEFRSGSGISSPVVSEERSREQLSDSVKTTERKMLLKVLEEVQYRRNEAARILGIGRSTLWRKIKMHDLENVPSKKQ